MRAPIAVSTLLISLTMARLPGPATAQNSSPSLPSPDRASACRQFCVREYGAIGDGQTTDTRAIQRSIDEAGAGDGGVVRFPPGRYLSGTVVLKSGVTLRLEAGATLLGSTDLNDYRVITPAFDSRTNAIVNPSLIYAENLQNVSITGEGAIDGQGAAFKYGPDHLRPYVLRFVTCRNVCIEGITLRNSPGWMQHYLACDDVLIRGIRVLSHANYNNDMMDIDCCRNVRIIDCIGDTGDDAIAIKSTGNRACENITIANCVVSSHCNAIKLGTESNGGFRNIAISNCVVHPSEYPKIHHGKPRGLAGIALELVDGGTMDQIVISNITMTGVEAPLFVRLGNRARPIREDLPKPSIGALRNIMVSNLVATGAGETGCAIAGLPGHPIENVSLSNIMISMAGSNEKPLKLETIPEKPEAYPECTMFGVLPAYGFFCRHVDGLRLRNVDVRWVRRDERSAFVCDDVRDLEIDGLRAKGVAEGAPVILLNDVHGALVRGCVAPRETGIFMFLQGKTDKVSALCNDLSAAGIPFEFGDRLAETILHQAGNCLNP